MCACATWAHEPRDFVLSITENPDLALSIEGEPATRVTVAPDEQALLRVYLSTPPGTQSNTAQSSPVRIWASVVGGTERVYSDTVFNGRNQ
jgi:hypothetical protein